MKKNKVCCSEENKEERKAQVRKALYGAYYPSDSERDYAIDSFTKSTLSIEEISQLTEPLKHISSSAAKAKAKIFKKNLIERMGGIQ